MKKVFLLLISYLLFLPISKPVHAATYDTYVNTNPSIAPITTDNAPIVTKLESEVNKMIIDQNNDGKCDHLAPGLFNNGLNMNSQGYQTLYWNAPSELISTLSAAYPYLSATLKSKVKSCLDSEMTTYPPLSTAFFPPNSGKVGDQPGVRREFWPVDTTAPLNMWPGPAISIRVAYALWQYTFYTGDRRFIDNTTNWNSLVSLYNSVKSSGVKYYSDIVGITGFIHLAQLKGDSAMANDAITLAKNAISSTPFSTFSTNANAKLRVYRQNYPIFQDGLESSCCSSMIETYFARELGNYLRENELTAVQAYSQQIEKEDPLWYMTLPNWGGNPDLAVQGTLSLESFYAPPDYSWTNFMIHANIFKEPMATLKTYLDFPSRLGDLFYIQELVTTIEAPSSAVSITPTSALSPTPTVTLGNGDTNNDGVVNATDLKQLLQNWLALLTNAVDQYGDGRINALDFVRVIKQMPTPTVTLTSAPTITSTPLPSPTPTPCPTTCSGTTKTFQVNQSADDVNETDTAFDTSSSQIWLGGCGSPTMCDTGLRFTNVQIPQGALITSAKLDVTSPGDEWISVSYDLFAEKTSNSQPFTATAKPSQRTLTTAKTSVSDDVQWLANTSYQLEMKSVIQEVVNQTNWQSGNAVALIATATNPAGFGRKSVYAFDGSSTQSPKLIVTYQ